MDRKRLERTTAITALTKIRKTKEEERKKLTIERQKKERDFSSDKFREQSSILSKRQTQTKLFPDRVMVTIFGVSPHLDSVMNDGYSDGDICRMAHCPSDTKFILLTKYFISTPEESLN